MAEHLERCTGMREGRGAFNSEPYWRLRGHDAQVIGLEREALWGGLCEDKDSSCAMVGAPNIIEFFYKPNSEGF